MCVCIQVFINVFIRVTPPGQKKNDTNLKFGTHNPIDLIKKRVFQKSDPKDRKLKKTAVSCGFFHISPRLPCYTIIM